METKNSTLIDILIPRIENKILILAKDIVLVLSFTTLTGICAKLKIEIGPIPITMQTFAVLLSGAILGSIRGATSQFVYLIFGLAGIPWFSREDGLSYLFSPTFGYLLGFIFASFFVGFLCERGFDRKIEKSILAMVIGNIVLYLPGLVWLARFVSFERVLAVGFYPFILGDLLKIFLASSLLPFCWKVLKVKNKK